jgi:hypothetical protein
MKKEDMLEKEENKEQVKLRRLEIIFSQAIEDDFFELFEKEQVGKNFTRFPAVTGSGFSTPKLGNDVWPQLNAMLIIYCSKEEAEKIRAIVNRIRHQYPTEGIACYISKAREL